MNDNLSPEEKLLRLIRKDKKPLPERNPDTGQKNPVAAAHLSQKTLGFSWKTFFSFLSVKYLRIAMWILFAISGLILAVTFVHPLISSPDIIKPGVIESGQDQEEATRPLLKVKPYEFYAAEVSKRAIFNAAAKQASGMPASIAGTDLLKDISLIGIISGDNPQAIIEDKKAQKTYYLSKGQFVGEFQVEQIAEGRIILNLKGQQYELNL